MPIVSLNRSIVTGFTVHPDGAVADFEGTLKGSYSSLKRASAAARRKYKDSSISITSIKIDKRKFRISDEDLEKIGTEI